MADNPDSVVIELIAKTDNFDGKVKQSATTNKQSMDQIVADAGKAEAAVARSSSARINALKAESAQISSAARIIGTQITDIGSLVNSNRSPFVSIPAQAPVVSKSLGIMKLATSTLSTVLGGVFITAGIAAVEMLLQLAKGADSTADEIAAAVEKLKEHAHATDIAKQATEVFANTLEGEIATLDDLEAALGKTNDAEKTAARLALEAAAKVRLRIQATREQALAELELARAFVARAQAEGNTGTRGSETAFELRQLDISKSLKSIDELEAKIKRADGALVRANRDFTAALANRVVELAQKQADPLDAIKLKYEGSGGLIDQAKRRALAEGTVSTELAKQIRLLEKAQAAEEKAARAAARKPPKGSTPRGESGREVTSSEAAAIARAAGLQVNSASRTFAEQKKLYDAWMRAGRPSDNPVAPPGTSAHEGAKGRWALDIQFGQGVTPDLLRKVFAAQGVNLSKVFKERGHFHVEGSRTQADSQDTALAAAADKELQRRQGFENELASLSDSEIEARQALVTSAEEIAQLELASIEISRTKYNNNVKSLEDQGKLTEAEGAELIKLNDERAALRAELVKRREDQRKFRMAEADIERKNAVEQGGLEAQQEVLQAQQGIARTQQQRFEIGQRLVTLQFQEERLALQAAIAREARLKAEYARTKSQETLAELEQAEADAAIARQRLQTLPAREGAALQGSAESNQSPLQSYFGDIQKQADDINSSFEMIAAGGLATFTDALTDAIVNFKSLGDVGRAVLQAVTADLVKLAIRLIINATIGRLVAKAATISTAASATSAAAAWAPAAAAASLATLGANAGPAAAAITATNALALATFAGTAAAGGAAGAGMAGGGRIYGSGTPTSDSVPINASRDEFMIRARSARNVGYDVLDYINRNGELPSSFARGGMVMPANNFVNRRIEQPKAFAAGGRIEVEPTVSFAGGGRIEPNNAVAANPRGASSMDLSGLRSIVSEAVNAMPDVSLYTSLDPVDVLQRALGHPAGEKALVTSLGRNAGKVKATIG